jgi:hypothetical protein
MEVMTWVAPIIVAVVGGIFSYFGVAKTAKAAHDRTILEIRNEQEKQSLVIGQQINEVKADIIRLEAKQDKHNAVIERTFKLEQKVEDMEKRLK